MFVRISRYRSAVLLEHRHLITFSLPQIDAALVAQHKTIQKEETIVQMENGCICCTLRGDLLEEVAALAAQGGVDYLVIESCTYHFR